MSEKLPEWICHGIYIRARDGTGIAECGSVEIATKIAALQARNERLETLLTQFYNISKNDGVISAAFYASPSFSHLQKEAKAALEEGKK